MEWLMALGLNLGLRSWSWLLVGLLGWGGWGGGDRLPLVNRVNPDDSRLWELASAVPGLLLSQNPGLTVAAMGAIAPPLTEQSPIRESHYPLGTIALGQRLQEFWAGWHTRLGASGTGVKSQPTAESLTAPAPFPPENPEVVGVDRPGEATGETGTETLEPETLEPETSDGLDGDSIEGERLAENEPERDAPERKEPERDAPERNELERNEPERNALGTGSENLDRPDLGEMNRDAEAAIADSPDSTPVDVPNPDPLDSSIDSSIVNAESLPTDLSPIDLPQSNSFSPFSDLLTRLRQLSPLGHGSPALQPIPSLTTIPGEAITPVPRLQEVPPPDLIQRLSPAFDRPLPQVQILSPTPNARLTSPQVTVELEVQDYDLFQDPELGLGPHLAVVLDDQPARAVYDLTDPLVLQDLQPGSHTLRVFAVRPWLESFKNAGAFAQVTFQVYAATPQREPQGDRPLLTAHMPQGTYGAEPILLDFYLTNAPLHFLAEDDPTLEDWRIRCTLNGESFLLSTWEPIYLTGFQEGTNWVQLELLDGDGEPLVNVFNTTVQTFEYVPGGGGGLTQLMTGNLTWDQAQALIHP